MQYIKLKNAFTIQKGKKVEQIPGYQENCVRCIQIEDLRHNDTLKYCLPNEKHVIAEEEDILIAWDGANAGTVGTGLFGALGSTLAKLTLKTDKLLAPFVAILLQSKFDYFQQTATGATIPHISRKALEDIDLPVIDVEIQKKIVRVINSSLEVIKKRQSQIAALDELVQSVFFEMFGDSVTNDKNFPTKSLSEIAAVGSSKRVFVKEIVDEGVPFYRGTEIGSLALGENISPKLFITEEHYNSLKKSSGVPKVGDLLMPSICPDGRIWRVKDNDPFYFKDGRVLWIHFTVSDINTLFIQYALKEKLIKDYLNIASGTTFAELKIFSLKEVKLMIPPLELQKKFAVIVGEIEAQKKVMEASLQEMENVLNSLMQKAFHGDLFKK